mgnify:CR=1 FL=1
MIVKNLFLKYQLKKTPDQHFKDIQKSVLTAKKEGIEYKKGQLFSSYLRNLNKFLKSELPKGYEVAFEKSVSKTTNEITSMIPYVVEANPQITGDDLQDARVQIDQQKNEPYVSLEFKAQGAKGFENLTGTNTAKVRVYAVNYNVLRVMSGMAGAAYSN